MLDLSQFLPVKRAQFLDPIQHGPMLFLRAVVADANTNTKTVDPQECQARAMYLVPAGLVIDLDGDSDPIIVAAARLARCTASRSILPGETAKRGVDLMTPKAAK